MKICAYCGRENEQAAVQCRECGTTEFRGRTALDPSKTAQVIKLPVIIPGLWLLGIGVVLLGIAIALCVMGDRRGVGDLLGLLFAKQFVLSKLIKSAKVRLSWPHFLTKTG
jgi:ribosomal protein L40E